MSPVITRAELCLLYPSAVWRLHLATVPAQLPAISPLKCNSRLVPPLPPPPLNHAAKYISIVQNSYFYLQQQSS